MRLHWICQQPTPYNNYLFRSLASDLDIDLQVHFVSGFLPSHPWQSVAPEGFSSRYFARTLGVDAPLLKLAFRETDSLFVIAGWNEPTMQAVSSALASRGRPFALWTDTPDLRRRRGMIKSLARSHWLRFLFAKAMAVMGTGRPALEALRVMGCPEAKLINLPCFVDLGGFRPRATQGGDAPIVFASSGRLIREKGYDLALHALARVFSKRRGDFSYRIAGTGPELDNLKRLTEELEITRQVAFVGWLEPQDLPQLFAEADVFLHPARWEPYGVAVLEAMASGNVVIGSDSTGAVLDRIRSGVNGFVHRTDDPGDLAHRIEEVVGRWPEMKGVRTAARLTAEEWPVSRGTQIIRSLLERVARPT